jgi:hypothetical protein
MQFGTNLKSIEEIDRVILLTKPHGRTPSHPSSTAPSSLSGTAEKTAMVRIGRNMEETMGVLVHVHTMNGP